MFNTILDTAHKSMPQSIKLLCCCWSKDPKKPPALSVLLAVRFLCMRSFASTSRLGDGLAKDERERERERERDSCARDKIGRGTQC